MSESPAFQEARAKVLDRLASSGVDGPTSMAVSRPAVTTVAPEGATPEPSPDAAPATLPGPATVKAPAKAPGLIPQSQVRPKAAQNGSGSSHDAPPTPFRGRPPEHQAQMRRMNALTNAVAVVPALIEKPTTVRAVLRLAAHFERWVASGVVPDA